jgi:glucose-1-phosphate cytidylyltransferase
MKVVLFCGGLGTRIREYSESVPKPMIPIGQQPIMWHVMQYYSHFGHTDFILCLGYKANTVKEYFINYKPQLYADCVLEGGKIKTLGKIDDDWRVAMIDTGVWRNVGGRLWAVREHLRGEKMFLCNYSDGLTDVNLDDMVEKFENSDKIACFLAVHPPVTYHMADLDADGTVRAFKTSADSEVWINGGYFLFKQEIFDYLKDGEELVEDTFNRIIADGKMMAYRHTGFWRPMDTLRDRQNLEEMIEKGIMPWRMNDDNAARPD